MARADRRLTRVAGVPLPSDPLLPVVVLAGCGLVSAVAGVDGLTWAVLGGLAGHSLSGSV